MSDLAGVNALLKREYETLRAAFRHFLRRVRSPGVLARLTKSLQGGDTDAALTIIDDYLQEFANELSLSFVRVGRAEVVRAKKSLRVQQMARLVGKSELRKVGEEELVGSIDVGFDPNDARAARLMNKTRLDFLEDFSAKQKKAVKTGLAQSLREGDSYAKAARVIRDSVGLNETQVKAVNNYRSLLEGGSAEALQRELRDRRFDNTVMNAITRGDILNEDQINRMVDSYAERMAAYRADTIAATESHRVLSLARHEAWKQMTEQLGIEDEGFKRTWNATKDKRTRDTHRDMDGQTVVGFEPFQSSSGALLNYPGDPEAPAEEVIRCRCVETYELN